MKKGKEFFDMLSEKEKREFDFNFEHNSMVFNKEDSFQVNKYEHLDANFKSFRDFIYGSFTFLGTKQGMDYWMEIANRKNN